MGSFSFMKADNLTQVANIVVGSSYKLLIPHEIILKEISYYLDCPEKFEFEQNYYIENRNRTFIPQNLYNQLKLGYIKDYYQDYGNIGRRNSTFYQETGIEEQWDIYELIAIWNQDKVIFNKYETPDGNQISEIDFDMIKFYKKYSSSKSMTKKIKQFLSPSLINLSETYELEQFKLIQFPLKNLLKGNINDMFKPMDKFTNENRNYGIDLFNEYGLPKKEEYYGIKMVSCSYNGCYEELNEFSKYDPEQGWSEIKRN